MGWTGLKQSRQEILWDLTGVLVWLGGNEASGSTLVPSAGSFLLNVKDSSSSDWSLGLF